MAARTRNLLMAVVRVAISMAGTLATEESGITWLWAIFAAPILPVAVPVYAVSGGPHGSTDSASMLAITAMLSVSLWWVLMTFVSRWWNGPTASR